jgi:hypothetical protein
VFLNFRQKEREREREKYIFSISSHSQDLEEGTFLS